nr:acyltransferase [Marinicella sp. W31]MDC2875947.1 acyltransferase [Marinicella sp. W31]
MQAKAKSQSQLISIQILRAVAALSVVTGHTINEIHQVGVPYPELPFNFGIGVDIFFIVSGFVMVLTSGKLVTRPGASLEFMRRRIIRVVPLYWFYTTGMLLALLLFPTQLNHSTTTFQQVACSFLFLPCVSAYGNYQPVLSLGWTLNYEMFFYVLLLSRWLGVQPTPGFYASGDCCWRRWCWAL